MAAKHKEAYEHRNYEVEAVKHRDRVEVSFGDEEYKDPLMQLLSAELPEYKSIIYRGDKDSNVLAIEGVNFSDVETSLENSVEEYLDGEDDQDEL